MERFYPTPRKTPHFRARRRRTLKISQTKNFFNEFGRSRGVAQQGVIALSAKKCCERQKNGLNTPVFHFFTSKLFLQRKSPFILPYSLLVREGRERKRLKNEACFFLFYSLPEPGQCWSRTKKKSTPKEKDAREEVSLSGFMPHLVQNF